jgi:hypothetical protein
MEIFENKIIMKWNLILSVLSITIFTSQINNQIINCTHHYECNKLKDDDKYLIKIVSKFNCLCDGIQNDFCNDLELLLTVKHSNLSIECSSKIKSKKKELNGSSLVFVNQFDQTNSKSFSCNVSIEPLESSEILGYKFNEKLNSTNCSESSDEDTFNLFMNILTTSVILLSFFLFICLCIYYKCQRKGKLITSRENKNVVFKEAEIDEKQNPVLLSTMSKNGNNRLKIPMIQSYSGTITDHSKSFESSSFFDPTPDTSQLS